MKNALFFLLFLLPLTFGFSTFQPMETCECSGVSNVQITGQTDASVTYGWSAASGATEYRVWFIRSQDSYSTGAFTTTNTSYTFSSLSAGHYTFYVRAICGEEASGFIGTVDEIIN